MKTVREFSSPRTFSLWDALATHQQLLLRSPEDGDTIDLIFKEVFYLEIPQTLRGIRIDAPTPSELQRARRRVGRALERDEVVFILASAKKRYLVGAKNLLIEHNTLNTSDPEFYTAKYLHQSQQEDFFRQTVKESVAFVPPTPPASSAPK